MKKNIKSLALAALALVAVGCSNSDELSAPAVETSGEVSFSSSIESRVLDNQFESGDQIFVQSFDTDGAQGLSGTYSYSVDASFIADSSEKITCVEGEELSYIAIYPAFDQSGTALTNTESSFAYSVETDQSTLANVSKSQLLVGTAAQTAETRVALKFINQMSKIALSVMVDKAAVEMSALSASFTLKAETFVNISNDLSMASAADAVVLTPYTATSSFEILVAPQTLYAGDAIATVSYDSADYTWVIDTEATMSAGSVYEYTLFIDTASGTAVAVHKNNVDEYLENGEVTSDPDAELVIKTDDVTFTAAEGESTTISYVTNQTAVSASANVAWLTASAESGTLTIATGEANTTGEDRTAEVTITAGEGDNTASATIKVIQEAEVIVDDEPATPSTTYSVGDIYTDENGVSGLIYYVDDSEFHMVSLERQYGLAWSTATISASSNADIFVLGAKTDGALYSADQTKALGFAQIVFDAVTSNSTYIADSSTFPIFAWAESLGEGWIIPGRADLTNINSAFASTYSDYSTVITEAGGTAFSDVKLWMAMVKSDGSSAVSGTWVDNSYTTYPDFSNVQTYARAIKFVAIE